MSHLLFYAEVVIVFLAMITVLVFAHELGHYLFARWFGMGVEEFAVGFGRPILGIYYRRKYKIPLTEQQADAWERGELEVPMPEGLPKMLEACSEPGELVRDPEGSYLAEVTNFTVRALPIGGFVRIRGMTPEEQGREAQVPGGFFSRPPWQRFVVLAAGPVFSVLAGLVILVPYNMVVGKASLSHEPVVAYVDPQGRGAAAGLKEHDRILAVDGQDITDYFQVIQAVRSHPEVPLHFNVERAGKRLELVVTPMRDKEPTPVFDSTLDLSDKKEIQGKIGAITAQIHTPMPFGDATREACLVPVVTVVGLVKSALHWNQLKDQVGGPVSIVRVTAEATNEGLGQVVQTAAILSISLGIFNLLPIFPLDGGQMLVALAEMLRRGRRLSMRAQGVIATVGVSALFMLIVGALYLDFQRFQPEHPKPNAAAPK
ncbi:MAG TPA: M50 family metallopeptidase [Fimbriimonadaceae bacterium]|nr:M50 family metallopeptidase [Fimbriimonadaceae bacterium]